MRVLAVTQVAHLAERQRHVVGELDAGLAHEARGDRRVVRGRVRERLGREDPSRLERHVAATLELVENGAVAVGPRDDNDVLIVLRRRPQQRRAADVDLLLQLDAALARRCGLRVRIQVHGDEVDRLDALACELGPMRLVVTPRKQRGMNTWMQRLHAPAEKDGRSRLFLDRFRVHAFGRERGARAVGRDQIPAKLAQAARERDKTGRIRS